MTLQQIADALSATGEQLTRERIRQIETKALNKIRKKLRLRYGIECLEDISSGEIDLAAGEREREINRQSTNRR
jgi:hypothetical protein